MTWGFIVVVTIAVAFATSQVLQERKARREQHRRWEKEWWP